VPIEMMPNFKSFSF